MHIATKLIIKTIINLLWVQISRKLEISTFRKRVHNEFHQNVDGQMDCIHIKRG